MNPQSGAVPLQRLVGIDGLHVAVDATPRDDTLDALERALTRAKRAKAKVPIKVGGRRCSIDWRPAPVGRGRYRYSLENDLARVGIGVGGLDFPIHVQFKCRPLWEPMPCAWERACDALYRWLRRITSGDIRITVSMIALTADFLGLRLAKTDDVLLMGYGRSMVKPLIVYGQFNGFEVGARSWIFGRVGYDKIAEIRENKHEDKTWLLPYYGEIPEGETVRRVEFEIHGNAIRDILGSADLALVLPELRTIWMYLTTNWLRWTRPTDDKNPSRWPTRCEWEAVQRATWPIPGEPLPLVTNAGSERALDADIANLRGCVERVVARVGRGTDLEAEWIGLLPYMTRHYANRVAAGKPSFADALEAKAIEEGTKLEERAARSAIEQAKAVHLSSVHVPDDVWVEVERDQRGREAVLLARGEDPTPEATALRALVREAEARAPASFVHDEAGRPCLVRDPASPRAWQRLAALYRLAVALNCADEAGGRSDPATLLP